MKCPVCHASWEESRRGSVCPQCAFDAASPDSRDTEKVLAAREAFKTRVSAYAPDTRVSRWDRWRPWLAVVLGFIIFALWLRACASAGGHMFRRAHYRRY